MSYQHRMDAQGWLNLVDILNGLAHEEFLRVWPPSNLYYVYEESGKYAFKKAAEAIGLRTIDPEYRP